MTPSTILAMEPISSICSLEQLCFHLSSHHISCPKVPMKEEKYCTQTSLKGSAMNVKCCFFFFFAFDVNFKLKSWEKWPLFQEIASNLRKLLPQVNISCRSFVVAKPNLFSFSGNRVCVRYGLNLNYNFMCNKF